MLNEPPLPPNNPPTNPETDIPLPPQQPSTGAPPQITPPVRPRTRAVGAITLILCIVCSGLTGFALYRVNQIYDLLDNATKSIGLDDSQDSPVPVAKAEAVVEGDDPRIGPEDAKVTLIGFSDFECPYCASFSPEINQILEDYGDQVRYVFRDFPLEFHENSLPAAVAAQCIFNQAGSEGFFQYHDGLFENQAELSDELYSKLAEDIEGIDKESFESCYNNAESLDEVAKDYQDGAAAGVSGTPAVFVNGRLVKGADPETVRQYIDEELEK